MLVFLAGNLFFRQRTFQKQAMAMMRHEPMGFTLVLLWFAHNTELTYDTTQLNDDRDDGT
jgi:hypothetical protein